MKFLLSTLILLSALSAFADEQCTIVGITSQKSVQLKCVNAANLPLYIPLSQPIFLKTGVKIYDRADLKSKPLLVTDEKTDEKTPEKTPQVNPGGGGGGGR